HPEALEGLERIRETAPNHALRAAGRILCSHPEVEAPAWVVAGARRNDAALRYELVEEDDPAVGRLVGLSASAEAVEVLLDLAGPPRRSDAAVTGLLAVPASRRTSP
ncbi:MAG: hypothetical protein GWM90_10900, partial [Gemmatimonadetes bacterium]|nr:hypothetical protein [Gemmatimonadota bacterium]NIQ54462.1 hypothetical protein [Gemmatimonadota bacterium]NIU74672.1 hypothetical protein [Gammaproteobacteria bacterium]NIX44601.1 hypothetical protein [Gemmatimonadota bacterium]NIY08811.1 hypothetical protein [Gemmatimonadota bacterium]